MDAFYEESDIVLRPANYPDEVVGKGYTVLDFGSYSVAVVNLLGTVFMQNLENPFFSVDRILEKITSKTIIVDFHAEATAEKIALGYYLDGKATIPYFIFHYLHSIAVQVYTVPVRNPGCRDFPVRHGHRRQSLPSCRHSG